MYQEVEIYHTKVRVPLPQDGDEVEDWGTDDPKEQYWRRRELPEIFDDVEFDRDGVALLTREQQAYAMREVRRCKKGFFFKSNGKVVYVTGKHYFYLQWWKLEDDIYPDYRDADRRYYLFLNHWENVQWCLGVARGKKRREGASSQATANLIYECIFYTNSNCGLVSKTNIDARETFLEMVKWGYDQLPVFLKPRLLSRSDSVTELVFDVKAEKGETKSKGNRSKVNYRATVENAYDRGRMSRVLADEGGKWEGDAKFSKFISKVSKTLVKGAKRVGFMEAPSTVNELTKGGGDEYQRVWKNSDHVKTGGKKTPFRFVTYFTPAYDNYEGFIDKYGESVIDEPNEDQYQYLLEKWVVRDEVTGECISELSDEDIRLGAKAYIFSRRVGLEGDELEEEIRQNPTSVKEMFEAATSNGVFPEYLINQQLDFLSYNEGELIERGDLVWENNHAYYREFVNPDGTIDIVRQNLVWQQNPKGVFEKVKGWEPKEKNNVILRNGYFFPNGMYATRIGCDPFKFDKTKDTKKSNCAAYVYQMEDATDERIAFVDMFTMRYVGRAATTEIQYDNVLKLAWYCGTKVLFERNVNNWKDHFKYRKASGFLSWLPGEVEPGIYTDSSGNVVQQICDLHTAYIHRSVNKIYWKDLLDRPSGYLGFKVENTQESDDVMGSGFALISGVSKKYKKQATVRDDVDNILPYRKAG